LSQIFVTGGLGYIGSHTCVALAEAGHAVTIVDNLSNAKPRVLERIRELAPGAQLSFHANDIRDAAALERIFSAQPIEAVVHFAGLKAVGESVEKPLLYYDNNVAGSITLLGAMRKHGVRQIVFSSSATVYGEPATLPIPETHPLGPANPYGRTKEMIEKIIADSGLLHATLRYFNPTGAHPSARIGEDPAGIPNNLFPYIAQVAVGRRAALNVWGRDYPTPDGTGVRDYIHVVDLAAGHVAALRYLGEKKTSLTVNLGTGRGYSVLEAVKAFECASGKRIPVEFGRRRPGDVAACYADASVAARELGWRTRFGLEEMCQDVWRWQSRNPEGYG
jgi:UDP-glucose 4-epimerase